MKNDKWILIAKNIQGAKVYELGATKRAVINKFDNVYTRAGWQIMVSLNDASKPDTFIKRTYR